jgi:hypothetical protein
MSTTESITQLTFVEQVRILAEIRQQLNQIECFYLAPETIGVSTGVTLSPKSIYLNDKLREIITHLNLSK